VPAQGLSATESKPKEPNRTSPLNDHPVGGRAVAGEFCGWVAVHRARSCLANLLAGSFDMMSDALDVQSVSSEAGEALGNQA